MTDVDRIQEPWWVFTAEEDAGEWWVENEGATADDGRHLLVQLASRVDAEDVAHWLTSILGEQERRAEAAEEARDRLRGLVRDIVESEDTMLEVTLKRRADALIAEAEDAGGRE